MQQFREVSRTRTIYSTQHMQATLYLIRSEMGSQCSFSRRGVAWSVMTGCQENKSVLQRESSEFSGEVG